MPRMTDPLSAPADDQGLRCLTCDYNLTGINSEQCPECGVIIPWTAVRQRAAHIAAVRPATPWDTPGVCRISGFVRTLMLASLAPQRLARRYPIAVDMRAARRYALTCWALGEAVTFALLAGCGTAGYLRLTALDEIVWAELLTAPASLVFWLVMEVMTADLLSCPVDRESPVPRATRHWWGLMRYQAGWLIPGIPAVKLLVAADEPWLFHLAAVAASVATGCWWICVAVCYLLKSRGSTPIRLGKVLVMTVFAGAASAVAALFTAATLVFIVLIVVWLL